MQKLQNACLHLPQVCRDWRGQDRDSHSNLSVADKSAWIKKINSFFQRKTEGKTPAKGSLKQKQLANKYSLLATDGTLQGMGSSLEAYVNRSASTVRLPLQLHERRWFEPVENMPADVAATSAGRTKIACIADARTRESCIELDIGKPKQNLYIHADRGPSSRPSLVWAYCEAKLQGFFFWDVHHDRHNVHVNTLSACSLAQTRHEICLTASAGLGPWKSCGHWGKYSDCLEEFVQNGNHQDPLFQALYGFLCRDTYKGVRPLSYGSESHMSEIFADLRDPLVIDCEGESTKPGGWYRSFRRWRIISPANSKLLCAILRCGIVLGWWHSLGS